MKDGFFGRITGGGASAVLASPDDIKQITAFFALFFGIPDKAEVFSDRSASLGRVYLFFKDFVFSLDASFVPHAVPADAGTALTGSIACTRALVEFRFGTERLAAYARSDEERYRLAFPEGDGRYYRKMDENLPDGLRYVSIERDAEAACFAETLIGGRFASFPGGLP